MFARRVAYVIIMLINAYTLFSLCGSKRTVSWFFLFVFFFVVCLFVCFSLIEGEFIDIDLS